MDIQVDSHVATAAVYEATQLCQAVQEELGYGVLQKGDRSPVTVADFGSQALMCRYIREAFPNDSIVAEEDAAALRHPDQREVSEEVVRRVRDMRPQSSSEVVMEWIDYGNGQADSKRFWTLDPIDGTKGFLRGQQYAIALALIEEGQVQLGVLACPKLDGGIWLLAMRGEGVWYQPLNGGYPPRRIHVSQTHETAKARFCESVESGHSAHGDAYRLAQHLGIQTESVRLDSQAKYAAVARGDADIYLRLPTRRSYREKIWDHAAGVCALEEAGGTVTDIFGRPLDFSHGRTLAHNRGVVATNGHLHDRVIASIAALGIGQPTA